MLITENENRRGYFNELFQDCFSSIGHLLTIIISSSAVGQNADIDAALVQLLQDVEFDAILSNRN